MQWHINFASVLTVGFRVHPWASPPTSTPSSSIRRPEEMRGRALVRIAGAERDAAAKRRKRYRFGLAKN